MKTVHICRGNEMPKNCRWWVCALLLGIALIASTQGRSATTLCARWSVSQYDGIDELEQTLITLTNAERRKAGQTPVTLCPELRTASRQHSEEMGAKNYFGHYSPVNEWKLPWQRAYMAGYWGQQIGENVLMTEYTGSAVDLAAHCIKLWMDSPGHRSNILNTKWSLLGIGVCRMGRTLFATQLFAGPIVTLDNATLTATSGEQATLRINGTARNGAVSVWVDSNYLQTAEKTGTSFSTTISFPRNSGSRQVALALNNVTVWMATFDTNKRKIEMLKVTNVARADLVTSTETDITSFTGCRLTGSACALPGATVSLVCDGKVVSDLNPDTRGHFTFNVVLTKQDAPYRIGFVIGDLLEDMLFVDANTGAFNCRPD